MSRTILGFGHPLLDIMSHVDHKYLERYEIPLGSCNLAAPEQLMIFEDLSQRRDVEFVPGGASMNTVRVARWMYPTGKFGYVGSMGDDEFGCILERALIRQGIEAHFQHHDEKQTGTCACLIVEKERSLLANLGAALDFSMDHILSPEVQKAIQASDFFYCEGFFLNTASSPDNTLHIGKHCVQFNKTLTYNLSAPYLCHIFKDRWVEILPYIDIVFGSRIDIEAFADALEWEERPSLPLIMRRMATMAKVNSRKERLVVITGGSDATYVVTKDDFLEFKPDPVPPEEIVDTNGAGDAFVGGFLSQYMQDKPLTFCVKAGHLSAAEVIRNNGCTFSETPPSLPSVQGS